MSLNIRPSLVVIEGNKYTNYTNGKKVIAVESDRVLDFYEVQYFRVRPIEFIYGANSDKPTHN